MAIQYSTQKMVSDGTLSTIVLGIQYLQRNDIYIRIAGEEIPQSGSISGYTWSFIDNTTLKILPVVPNGVEVVVYRRTDTDGMYNVYSQSAQFDESTIDENNTQLLYIAQEYLEQGATIGVDTIEYLRDDGTFTYYRIKRTDGSYSAEFAVPSAGSITKVLARAALSRTYNGAGLNLVDGSFEVGGTIVRVGDVLLHEASGAAYGWAGALPKEVDAGTNTAGFIDKSKSLTAHYVNVDALLLSANLRAGDVVSTGVTDWRIITQATQWLTASGLYALPLNGVWFADFQDFDGTGTTGMSALLQSVIDKAQNTAIMLGNNTIRIDAPITYRSGTIIRGAGRKGLYGYVSGVDSGGTLVVVDDGITAFATDVQWCHYPEISGMTFRAKTHGSSTYGQPANFSRYTNGIDVLYTVEGVFKNLGFESMDFGIFNRLGSGQQAFRPQITDIVAQDCSRVFSFLDGAADVNISNVPIALHCNRMIHCISVDGIQITNVRFFQAHERSLSFIDCQFVTGANVTCFETANTQMEVVNCDNVNMSALTLSRAGWYHAGTPFPAQKALVINNSRNVKLSGSIERPSGKAVEIVGSDLVEVDFSIRLPYSTNGGPSAITVATSKSVKISGSAKIRGNATFTVELDSDSMYETTIDMTSDMGFKNIRFCRSNQEEVKQSVSSGILIGAGGSSVVLLERSFRVPAGKLLTLTGVRYNQSNGLRPRIGANFFLTIGSDGEGVAYDGPITLLDNSAGSTVQTYNLQVQLYNNTGAAITTPLSEIVAIVKVLPA